MVGKYSKFASAGDKAGVRQAMAQPAAEAAEPATAGTDTHSDADTGTPGDASAGEDKRSHGEDAPF